MSAPLATDADSIETGTLDGLPYRTVGTGPLLVYLPPFAPYHELPRGFSGWIETRIQRAIAVQGFRVTQINRPLGLASGTTMEDLAARTASAIAKLSSEPVDVVGFSTGAALALCMAATAPEVVRSIVVASGAHRMSDLARAACAEAARRAEAGDRRGFQVALAAVASSSPLARRLAATMGWLLAPLVLRPTWDSRDAVATLRADERFDLSDRLSSIRARTLLVCGDSDPSYPLDLTAELQRRIPGAQRHVYARTGHGVILHRRFAPDVSAFLRASP